MGGGEQIGVGNPRGVKSKWDGLHCERVSR